ncbi:NADH-quinone oxidoreductase subunit H [Bienertia sinuspersici]
MKKDLRPPSTPKNLLKNDTQVVLNVVVSSNFGGGGHGFWWLLWVLVKVVVVVVVKQKMRGLLFREREKERKREREKGGGVNGSSSIQVKDEQTGTVHLVGPHFISSASLVDIQTALIVLCIATIFAMPAS